MRETGEVGDEPALAVRVLRGADWCGLAVGLRNAAKHLPLPATLSFVVEEGASPTHASGPIEKGEAIALFNGHRRARVLRRLIVLGAAAVKKEERAGGTPWNPEGRESHRLDTIVSNVHAVCRGFAKRNESVQLAQDEPSEQVAPAPKLTPAAG